MKNKRRDYKGEFGHWLSMQILLTHKSLTEVSRELGMSRRTLYRHLNRETRPSYLEAIGYCCYFNCLDDINYVRLCIRYDWGL